MKYPEHPGLMAAVIADAEDDAPRLIYADWLEENGDPVRAEFIRVGCALADLSPADPRYVDLVERKAEVLAAVHSRRDLAPKLPAAVGFLDNPEEPHDDSGAGFHRGFPYFAGEPDDQDDLELRHALELRDALPQVIETTTLRGLRIYFFTHHLAEILSSPAAAHLSALAVYNAPLDEDETLARIDTIVSSPAAQRLKWLKLDYIDSDARADVLARAKALGRMRRLDVRWLKHLRAAPWFGRLRRVEIGLSAENAAAGVVGLAKLPELHTLKLHDFSLLEARAALEKGPFAALGGLSLLFTHLRGDGAAALARARMPELTALDLPRCWLRSGDVVVLSCSELFSKLRVLSLNSNEIGDKGVAAVADSPCAGGLRILRLGDNKFGKRGLAALADGESFPSLTTLDLGSDETRKASAEEMTEFLTALDLPRLRHLDLHGWPVDDRGAKALAANPAFANLTCLNLGSCRIGAKGAAALFASPHLRRLVKLDLSMNSLRKFPEALLDPAVMPDLCECWLPPAVSAATRERLEAARGDIFI
jgi:uncharacterized protein (TIGR02996 family)